MYDKIVFILTKEHCRDCDFLQIFSDNKKLASTLIESVAKTTKKKSCFCKLENLIIHVTDDKVKISGSFCKYYLDNNVQTLTLVDIKKAIEKLSIDLEIPIQKAEITSLEFGTNLIVKEQPREYCDCLGQAKSYKRSEQPDGLRYEIDVRKLVFYDKVKEAKHSKVKIPNDYRGLNLLRYEIRFEGKRELKTLFKDLPMTMETLYNPIFYDKLLKRWKSEYKTIQKLSNSINMKSVTTKKELDNILIAKALSNKKTSLDVQKVINSWDNRTAKSRAKANYKKALEATKDVIPNQLIIELNKAIDETM